MHPEVWPLVGREHERAVLSRAVDANDPQSVVIAGPPGVGRTRLAREALALAQATGRRSIWAAATSATARVSLGALAHLLPPLEAVLDPLGLLQQAVRAIVGVGGDAPPVLVVDDVHLLDLLSVSLLHQLAVSRAATLVLTVCTSAGTPDPVAPLWKDGQATRLEVPPLTRDDADLLIRSVLGGEVETRTSERLWLVSRGNPLFLHELLAEGRRAGRLHDGAGLWRWPGPLRPSQRLAEIVLAQVGVLDQAEWRVLEVLSAREPLHIDQLIELSSPAAVDALVRRGLVVECQGTDPDLVCTAHPLYTAVVRQRTSTATVRKIRRRLADGSSPSQAADDFRFRSAVLLDTDPATRDPAVLTEAAQRANALLDHGLAEELARAGIQAGAGPRAHLALVEATQWKGEPARSEQAAAAAPIAASEHDRAQLTAMRAISLFCGLDRAAEAFTLLKEAARSARHEEDRALLAGTEACLVFLAGDPRGAVQRASVVLDSARPDSVAWVLSAAAAAGGRAVTGRTTAALDLVRRAWAQLDEISAAPEVAFARIALAQAEVLALRYTGRMRELEQRAAELHQANLAGPGWAGDAVIALYRGCAALASGRPTVAIRWFVEALAGLDEQDPIGVLPLCVSELGMARALAGDVDRARDTIGEARGMPRQVLPIFRPRARLAEAWLAAADSRTEEAAACALDAATHAATTEQWCEEALALHTAARFGRGPDVVGRLRRLAQELDSPLVSACAAHVEAVVQGEGTRLVEVAKRFEDMGALLLAANAAVDAAAACEAAGERTAAAVSRALAHSLARQCGLPRTPEASSSLPPVLTAREEEVARRAAGGKSNQQIADELVLSVRTVETHLAHAYAKLGIGSRRQLADLLDEPPDQRLKPA